jgi:hypothetical protein
MILANGASSLTASAWTRRPSHLILMPGLSKLAHQREDLGIGDDVNSVLRARVVRVGIQSELVSGGEFHLGVVSRDPDRRRAVPDGRGTSQRGTVEGSHIREVG